MKLDRTFVREVKALCGDGSRDAKFAMLRRIDAARKDLSTTEIRRTFNDCIRNHGRAVVCVCVAATLDACRERIDRWGWRWAPAGKELTAGAGAGRMKCCPSCRAVSRQEICNVRISTTAYTPLRFVPTQNPLSE